MSENSMEGSLRFGARTSLTNHNLAAAPRSFLSSMNSIHSTAIDGAHQIMALNPLSQYAPSYPLPDEQDSYSAADKASPTQSDNNEPARTHRRGYQACENCRNRKSKCKLGSVDNPGEPPCERCRRERRPCEFAATRKKKRLSSDQGTPDRVTKRRLTSNSIEDDTNPMIPQNVSPYPATDRSRQWAAPPQPIHYTSQPRELASTSYTNLGGSNAAQFRSELANDTLHAAAATTQDNLNVLYRAAIETSVISDNQAKSPSTAFGSPLTSGSAARPRAFSNTMTPGHPGLLEQPGQTGATIEATLVQDDGVQSALRAWERMRFVRAGWFTASEAMHYVEYYYAHMAPMTPIVTRDYRSALKHLALLTEEPILAIAILAIASRHMKLNGAAAASRAYQIHDKLWDYLRKMVERLLWGQEQFGGGFCGGGASSRVVESTTGQITWTGSLRTVGTIEALLLLTDWQPRALHFPPGDDENRLLEADYSLLPNGNDAGSKQDEGNSDTLPYASWLEPAWRSDRMSWMLLGLAQALSFELGVFDNTHYSCKDRHDSSSDCARKRRVRRLVLVYVSQTSGRLGIPSMLPLTQWQSDPIFEQTYVSQRKGQVEDPIDVMQSCWLGIAAIMFDANQQIFLSRKFTKDLTHGIEYKRVVNNFKPRLAEWKQKFNLVSPQIQPVMRHILIMEYEYARCYINSLGLQKVVEQLVGRSTADGADQSVLLKMYNPNREYISEVTDSARNILRTIVEGLGPGGHLRNCPVRTYLRALSGMMFTLKRFSLGDFENEVRQSLDLLEKTTDFLSSEVVDDVHLANQTSNLVKLIVANIQKTFIRVQAPTNGSEPASREGSHPQSPHQGNNEQPQTSIHSRTRIASNGRYGANSLRSDPLAGIQAQPLAEISSAFMPPPNFGTQTNGFDQSMPIDPNMVLDDWNTDWLTLPLNNFFDSNSGSVDQGFGGIGPTVGDRDMLEVLTNQQYKQQIGHPAGTNMYPGFH